MATELWKDIKGFEGMYQVSNLGNTKTLSRAIQSKSGDYISKEKELKQAFSTTGCKQVGLVKNKKHKMWKVHRLVAFAFIGESPAGKPIINHMDGDCTNNNVNNLEWCNNSHNQLHAVAMGLRRTFKITKEQLQLEFTTNKLNVIEIANKYNTTKGIINNNCKKYGIKRINGDTFHLTLEFLEKELKTKTQTTLAKELGCTQSLICNRLKKFRGDLI